MLAAVIARKSGQSSIPEAAVLERIGRGVRDRPVKPGDDSVKTSMRPPLLAMELGLLPAMLCDFRAFTHRA